MRFICLLLAILPLAALANSYTPASGNMIGEQTVSIGNSDNTFLPGIGPAPAAWYYNIAADLNDSTAGNYNNFVSIIRQSGTRYASAITGTAVNSHVGGSVWGAAGIGICAADGAFCNGAQFEAESGASGINAQALILSVGPYGLAPSVLNGAEGSYPTTSYLSMVANPGYTAHVSPASPYWAIFLNDYNTNPINPNGTILGGGGPGGRLSGKAGIDLRNMHFSDSAFASRGFKVDDNGNLEANSLKLAAGFSSNGTTATSLGSVAPAGASATPRKWLTVKDAAGTTYYIPAF